jgi:hypothetical protein
MPYSSSQYCATAAWSEVPSKDSLDTARQVLRFSIPGSVLLLHGLACYFIFRACQHVSFAEASVPVRENIGALVAILATIPIGFVVYQMYYLSYIPVVRLWPRGWRGRTVRADRGWQILKGFSPGQIETLEKIFGEAIDLTEPHDFVPRARPWYRHPVQKLRRMLGLLEIKSDIEDIEERRKLYERRWYYNWDILRAILDITGSISGSSQIKSEYTTLSDIYHSLGAARTAVALSWTMVVLLVASDFERWQGELVGSLVGVLVISTLTLFLYFVLHTARRRTWKSASASLRLGLRWFFLKYADEIGSGLDDGSGSIAESLRTSLQNFREKAADAVPGRGTADPPAYGGRGLARTVVPASMRSRNSVGAVAGAVIALIALALTAQVAGALDDGGASTMSLTNLTLLIPGALGCLVGFYYARKPQRSDDRSAFWGLVSAATGAYTTILAAILIWQPSLRDASIAILASCSALALAAFLGGRR